MVTRSKRGVTGEKEQEKGRVKVGKLKLNKETVQDLTQREKKGVKGGGCTSGGSGVISCCGKKL